MKISLKERKLGRNSDRGRDHGVFLDRRGEVRVGEGHGEPFTRYQVGLDPGILLRSLTNKEQKQKKVKKGKRKPKGLFSLPNKTPFSPQTLPHNVLNHISIQLTLRGVLCVSALSSARLRILDKMSSSSMLFTKRKKVKKEKGRTKVPMQSDLSLDEGKKRTNQRSRRRETPSVPKMKGIRGPKKGNSEAAP